LFLKRLEIRDPRSACFIKRYITGAEILTPAMKEVIKEEKDQGFKRQNYYYNGEDHGQFLSKPETVTSLHSHGTWKSWKQKILVKVQHQKKKKIIKSSVLVETPKNSICWCNRYRLVPKANGNMRLVVDIKSESVHSSKTLQDGRNSYFRRFSSEEQLHNFIRSEGSLQPHTCASHSSKPIGNTIYGDYIYISGNAIRLALRVFTQIMKKCVMAIREIWGIHYVIYLDYLLLLHPNKDYLKKIALQITQFFRYYGTSKNPI
jgi:hypothetical protein